MATNTDPVKRYFARAWEDETKMPTFNPNIEAHQHEPLLALLAFVMAYFILDAATHLKHTLIDTILLRSFPGWSEQYSIIKPGEPAHWLRRRSPRALSGLIAITCLRIWNPENLWKLMARTVSWYMAFEAGSVALLWGFEQVLLCNHKVANWAGWVPFDEPEAYLRLSAGRAESQAPGEEPEKRDESKLRRISYPYTETDYFAKSLTMSAARCSRRIVAYWANTEAYRGTKVQASTGMETYHLITADEKYKAKSFEELRLGHYQEHEIGLEGGGQEEQAKSLLGKSISFLNDSLFGDSSLASRDSFGRTQEVLLDGVAAAQATEREGRSAVPDLLTGTPRKLFT